MLAVTLWILSASLYLATGRDHLSQALRASTQSIQGRFFEAEDIKIGPFVLLDRRIPDINCPSHSAQYTDIIAKGDGTYRVPHSRILMDGKKCGSLGANATEDELWVDSHMELFPIDFLLNETISLEKGTNAAFVKLQTHLRALSFYKFSEKRRLNESAMSQTWVGYERRGPRVCGGGTSGQELVVEQGSFVFFGKNDDLHVDISNLFPGMTEGSIVLRQIHPFHVMFQFIEAGEGEPTASNDETRQEVTCPLIFLDRTIREEAGEVRKCFPANEKVRRGDGELVRMDELRVGDVVMDGTGGASEVYFFSHRDSKVYSEFVSVFISGSRSVTLSEGHYIYTPRGAVAAGKLKVGEEVMVEGNGTGVVERIEWTLGRGLFNPHTINGGIVVGGVVASVYTDAVDARVAHGLLAPIRAVFWSVGGWWWTRKGLEEFMARGWRAMRIWSWGSSRAVASELLRVFGLRLCCNQ
eukprot:GFKZ01010228.1.p1 GENE.GFKZ01010228.1~~GFKZ01010228.1.p1  ORF type:complete len:469 (-),score=44.65 GFKZ01010228.1:79-1485(-)